MFHVSMGGGEGGGFRWERAAFLSGGYPMGGIGFGEGVFKKIVT